MNLSAKRQLTALGTVRAPAGKISLTLGSQPTSSDFEFYLNNQTLWLGANSVLDVGGVADVYADVRGLRIGTVKDAGSISLNAQKGTVVAEQGSIFNLAGTKATLVEIRQRLCRERSCIKRR